ncbi:hypothetical protein HKCCE3408_14685 [Rhodobacterales bacterium HKCCE3408]|nr:hypothetical protein [Rhodobacterales bacterium HKCCE3408]
MLKSHVPTFVLAALMAASAAAQTPYVDDRSDPDAVVTSYFNALSSHDYPRAWSYWHENERPPFDAFADGHGDIERIEIRTGEVFAEGAAGSVWWQVPVVARATTLSGTEMITAGCMILSQPRPELVDTPPYAPIAIRGGELLPADGDFDEITVTCEP